MARTAYRIFDVDTHHHFALEQPGAHARRRCTAYAPGRARDGLGPEPGRGSGARAGAEERVGVGGCDALAPLEGEPVEVGQIAHLAGAPRPEP